MTSYVGGLASGHASSLNQLPASQNPMQSNTRTWSTMAFTPQPTERSCELLLSLPLEILHIIFDHALLDELYANKLILRTQFSHPVLPFSQVVRCTIGLRGACSRWASAVRSLVFRGKSTRRGFLLDLRRLLSAKDSETFPLLRDCMVMLCHPYNLQDIHALQLELSSQTTQSLEYVCAVTWDVDDPQDALLGQIQRMGYSPHAKALINTFIDECLVAGLKIANSSGERPNGGDHSDSERLRTAGRRAMEEFLFKETLALWWYNAQIARQILGAFPLLKYAVFPDYLHVPLLARMKYFFPQGQDDSPFAPVTLSRPQMLQTLGITYREGGQTYSHLMASLEGVTVLSMHVPAALPLFPERYRRVHSAFGPFLLLNQWTTRRGEAEIGAEILDRLRAQMETALADIPGKRMPTLFSIDDLKNALSEAIEL
ncbi:hypothetical protein BJY00DRAFT_282230 [Aspergillus carlsbadensis]|nr:hypothetical protein BJY00DRAFT_282230 [Aspergillus carlsbadensis]